MTNDARIHFTYLDNLIREDVFTIAGANKDRYQSKTTRFHCVFDDLNAGLTLTVAPRPIENGVIRSVYVEINSRGDIEIGEWARCLSAMFSFIFSTHISASETWDFSVPNRVMHPAYREVAHEEIGRDYRYLYSPVIHELPSVSRKWTKKWFAHPAYRLGMHKYLETFRRDKGIPVEIQIAIIAEAFLHYFGDSYDDSYAKKKNAEHAIKYQYERLSQRAGVRIQNKDSIMQIVRFYNRGKHFYGGSDEKDFVIQATAEERVDLKFFVQSLFQFCALYDLLEGNRDTFKTMYRELVKPHSILKRFYVI